MKDTEFPNKEAHMAKEDIMPPVMPQVSLRFFWYSFFPLSASAIAVLERALSERRATRAVLAKVVMDGVL